MIGNQLANVSVKLFDPGINTNIIDINCMLVVFAQFYKKFCCDKACNK